MDHKSLVKDDKSDDASSTASSASSRRHSISCDPRDRSVLHSASDTRLPLRILARSLVSDEARFGCSPPKIGSLPPAPAIDVKFIQMYVKKLGPGYRQNSDPTFNRRLQRIQRNSEANTTSATNSGQSSSSLASSNDDVAAGGGGQQPKGQLTEHLRCGPSPVLVHPPTKRSGCLFTVTSMRRSSSGNDLVKEIRANESTKSETLSLNEISQSPFPNEPVVTCYRILESLFAGGLDSVTNPALLCRLKIDHVIDLRQTLGCHKPRKGSIGLFQRQISKSDSRPQSTSGRKQSCISNSSVKPENPTAHGSTKSAAAGADPSLTCLCPDWRHKRRLINLGICDRSTSMIDGFKKMNAFITNARVRGEKTLLFDEDARGMAPAAVVEYIMYYYRMTYSAARIFVHEIMPDMEIPIEAEKALLELQEEFNGDGSSSSTSHGRPASGNTCSYRPSTPPEAQQFMPKKVQTAWT